MGRFNVALNQDDDHLREAIIDFSATGSNQIIAGVAGHIIRVYKFFFLVSAATNITMLNGAIPLTGAIDFSANEGVVLDFDTKPWFTLSPGSAFNISQSGTAQIGGRAYYQED